jgi:hypothetical protein
MTVGSDCPHSLRPPLEGLLPAVPLQDRPRAAWCCSRVGGERFHVYSHLAPPYTLNPVGSDCPHRLTALLEISPRGAAACCAPTGSLQAAWRGSRVGGERFHLYNHERQRRARTRRKHLDVKPPIPPPTRASLGRVSRRQTRGRTGRQAFPRAFPFGIRAPVRAATDPGTRKDARAHEGSSGRKGAEPEGGRGKLDGTGCCQALRTVEAAILRK